MLNNLFQKFQLCIFKYRWNVRGRLSCLWWCCTTRWHFIALGGKNTLWSSLKDQECLVKKDQQLLHWFWRSDSNGAICWRILLFVSLMAWYFAGACFAVLSSFLCSLLEPQHDTLHKPLGKCTLIRQPIKNPLQKDA